MGGSQSHSQSQWQLQWSLLKYTFCLLTILSCRTVTFVHASCSFTTATRTRTLLRLRATTPQQYPNTHKPLAMATPTAPLSSESSGAPDILTLLVGTTTDAASMNIAQSLIAKYKHNWETIDANPESSLFKATTKAGYDVLLWIQNQPLLHLDHVDDTFAMRYPDFHTVSEVLFLSKHSAASGQASLTVHPIGIPWQTENSRSGGIPGRACPINPRIGSIYRKLIAESKAQQLSERFQVTMEATHHGPFVKVPSCFVEIGSTDADYDISEAGTIWADCLMANLGFFEHQTYQYDSTGGIGVILIGSGHYVPKANDAAKLGDHVYIGHCLATYALESCFKDPMNPDSAVPGGWRAIIKETIDATRIGLPGMDLICLVDKKAFNAPYRDAITAFLDEEAVPWTYKVTDIKAAKVSEYSKIARKTV